MSITYARDNESEIIRLVFDKQVTTKSAVLEKNSARGLSPRVYIDFYDAYLTKNVPKTIVPASSTILQLIRIGQREPKTVRLVCDTTHALKRSSYTIVHDPRSPTVTVNFPVSQPRRSNKKKHLDRVKPSQRTLPIISEALPPSPSVAGSLPLPTSDIGTATTRRCIIVIDPGHGGKDPGAIGYNGIQEKDVCLSLATALKTRLEQEAWCTVQMTRDSDTFLSLSQRAQFANERNADIFISLHTNAHDDQSLTGVETYYLDFSSDEDARKVAARENFTSPEAIGDLEVILFDLVQSSKINASSILAGHVHNALVRNLSQRYSTTRNLGVKHAPLRVLIDAEMPCIIIETAFITNPDESKRLTDPDHQRLLVEAIAEGIRNFKTSSAFASYSMESKRF
ncbi:MAG: N-acetylmuramoyl-L-alanine amidase [Desulfobacterota bacterium]|nr:N-acetylmuramoyl-L-alanine amidase [Thermodesulfobacteriota bacterium]